MIRQLVGDCRERLAELEPESVQTCVTSPPYYGLRDYGTPPLVWGADAECAHSFDTAVRAPWASKLPSAKSVTVRNNAYHESIGKTAGSFCACGAWLGSLGLEPTPELYLEHLVEVFRGVRRVLRDDGVLWLNLGDSYAGSGKGPSNSLQSEASQLSKQSTNRGSLVVSGHSSTAQQITRLPGGPKSKDLMLMPFRVAMTLQADGWWVRSVIPWLKRNAMPESVTDRPSTSVEYVFLLAKSSRYFFDADAVRTAHTDPRVVNGEFKGSGGVNVDGYAGRKKDGLARETFAMRDRQYNPAGRNRRNGDWFFESWQGLMLDEQDDPIAFVVNPQPLKMTHFASFAPKLVEPMVKASTRLGDTVLDPFGGSGTVGLVADRLGRDAVLIDLKPEYGTMAVDRIVGDAPLFVDNQ